MLPTTIRKATHAGSWYSDDGTTLKAQLTRHLTAAGASPEPDARLVIAPHAGYAYSAATAAEAYSRWDVEGVERVFVLGPSHHVRLSGCALPRAGAVATPLGDLKVDAAAWKRLAGTGHFTYFGLADDEAEHSLEMHYPLIHATFTHRGVPVPAIVPIVVGELTPELDRIYGDLLALELADPAAALVVSTDFCHWGQSRFGYTWYTAVPMPSCTCTHPRAHHHAHDAGHAAHSVLAPWGLSTSALVAPEDSIEERGWSPRADVAVASPTAAAAVHHLGAPDLGVRRAQDLVKTPIHESIKALDHVGMHLIAKLDLPGWTAYLRDTKNTICGRNPLRVMLVAVNALYEAALEAEALEAQAATAADAAESTDSLALPSKPDVNAQPALVSTGRLPVVQWVGYAQSSACVSVKDYSVSYAAAIVTVPASVERVLGGPDDEEDGMSVDEREVLKNDEDMAVDEDDEDEDGNAEDEQ
ncbi:memo-like protein-domain-containing protein [Blastocladiella britannica]|nr:memo-like protein-domain-containing protein [Blastocladiella britannica]